MNWLKKHGLVLGTAAITIIVIYFVFRSTNNDSQSQLTSQDAQLQNELIAEQEQSALAQSGMGISVSGSTPQNNMQTSTETVAPVPPATTPAPASTFTPVSLASEPVTFDPRPTIAPSTLANFSTQNSSNSIIDKTPAIIDQPNTHLLTFGHR